MVFSSSNGLSFSISYFDIFVYVLMILWVECYLHVFSSEFLGCSTGQTSFDMLGTRVACHLEQKKTSLARAKQ